MRDIKKILDVMMKHREIVGENSIEYTGCGEGENLLKFIVEKFALTDRLNIESVNTKDCFMDLIYSVFDCVEEIFDYNPETVNGVSLSEIGYFDSSEIIVAEYLCSSFCSDESYEEFINDIEDGINEYETSYKE